MLATLLRAPRWVPAIVLAALLVAGLGFGGLVGAACLAVVALLLGWLTYLSWPVVPSRGRAVRLAVLTLVLGAAAALALR